MSLLRLCIIEIIAGLQSRGFNGDFSFNENHLQYLQEETLTGIDNFSIHDIHYFPGRNRLVNDLFIMAVEDLNSNTKGIVMVRKNKKNASYLEGIMRDVLNLYAEEPILSNG